MDVTGVGVHFELFIIQVAM